MLVDLDRESCELRLVEHFWLRAAMRTRRGNYPSPRDGIIFSIRPSPPKRKSRAPLDVVERPSKFYRVAGSKRSCTCHFDLLPDDLLINIAMALASTASSPADLINMMLICRRFCAAATHSLVLSKAGPQAFAVKAKSWSPAAHRFLKQCADAGNVEAQYTLGMIRFYCLNNITGASLMAKAAMASHPAALHSLAVIQFNGSGGRRKDKDLKAGAALCLRAATLGHLDAIRELGHCLQDGYGVPKNVPEGRKWLLEANLREAAAAVTAAAAAAAVPRSFMELALRRTARSTCMNCPHQTFFVLPSSAELFEKAVPDSDGVSVGFVHPVFELLQNGGCALLSDFGYNVPLAKVHVANRFLIEWFALHPPEPGLRLCSHANCGRPETRRHEFRRCSACGRVNYCSRACQALDWKLRHKYDCCPVADWEGRGEDVADVQQRAGRADEEDDNVEVFEADPNHPGQEDGSVAS